jgi:hypothetical protein
MTVTDVEQARDALLAQGVHPSQRAILSYIGKGSKRDVARFLRVLDQFENVGAALAAGVTKPDPVLDPVTLAEQGLAAAEARLAEARDTLLQAKGVVLCARNLVVENVLHGSLHPHDEIHAQALADCDDAKRHYDAAWQARASARAALERATREHRLGHQEAWVQVHHPELVRQRDYWQEELRTAKSDRQSMHAKKELSQALQAYHQAVHAAPWSSNGTTKE